MQFHGLHQNPAIQSLLIQVQYFEDFAAKYELNPYIKLNSRVVSATWDEAKGIYNIKVNSEGKEIDDWCHVLGRLAYKGGSLATC